MRDPKHHKATLFSGEQLLLGVNCLEPGQVQPVHVHDHQEKFYLVMAGEGYFTVGEEVSTAGPGIVVWAPQGVPHGVENRGEQRLVLFMGMAPPP